MQSFVEKELRRTGRKHTAEVVAAEIAMLHAAGIHNINIDLIAGLSGQTAASWRESLDWVERLAPEHVSVYMLEVDEDSRLGKEMLLGGVRYGALDTPSDDATADFYETGRRAPGRAGHRALRDLQLRAPRLRIAAQSEVLEAGAVRRLRRRRALLRRPHAPAESRIDRRVSVAAPARPMTRRTCPTSASSSACASPPAYAPTPEEWRRFDAPIHRFLDAGLLETDGGMLRLTNRGVLLSNEVFQEFLNL